MTLTLDQALAAIPEGLRRPLLDLYEEALTEYRAGRWESVGTKAGKVCEVVYTIINGKVSGRFPAKPSKPRNMVDACRDLEQHNRTHGRSLCIQIPKVLLAAYEMRNNRAIGHVGGDVDPNHMDAEFLIRAVKWLVAELVRVFGNLDTKQARELIESVTERSIHVVWTDGETRRVLNTSLTTKQKVLVLLYACGGKAQIEQLRRWAEYKNTTNFRTQVIKRLHKEATVHFDERTGDVTLLPPGVKRVEAGGLLS